MSQRLVVNPIACEAHGMCAELLPERITLDDWGYPIVDGRPLSADLLAHARRAAEACPTFALLRRGEGAAVRASAPVRASAGASRPSPPSARRERRTPEPALRRRKRPDLRR
jgi:ferredoxin